MGVDEYLPDRLLLTTPENGAGWARVRSVCPAPMGVCPPSGGVFNNSAMVPGVDHIVLAARQGT